MKAPTELVGVLLFGSGARNDADELSDTDVCFVLRRISAKARSESIRFSRAALGVSNPSPSIYSQSAFQDMATSGSLFLWHLKLEAKILFEQDSLITKILREVVPYSGYCSDLREYRRISSGALDSIRNWRTNSFDLGVLFTAARNAMMVATMRIESPVFGRRGYFRVLEGSGIRPMISEDEYEMLMEHKLVSTRGHVVTNLVVPEREQALSIAVRVRDMMEQLVVELDLNCDMSETDPLPSESGPGMLTYEERIALERETYIALSMFAVRKRIQFTSFEGKAGKVFRRQIRAMGPQADVRITEDLLELISVAKKLSSSEGYERGDLLEQFPGPSKRRQLDSLAAQLRTLCRSLE